jgi:hypothetical protein
LENKEDSSENMPHNDEFPSSMINMVLGYKHQHLQQSYVTDFFSVSKITLGKDLLYMDMATARISYGESDMRARVSRVEDPHWELTMCVV